MWKCDPIFGDVDNDGHLDLAAIPRLGDSPHVWRGDGRGNWTDSSIGLRPNPEQQSCGGGMTFADLNRDGHLDLAVADHCTGVYVYLGDGTGKWTMVTQGMHPTDLVPGEGKQHLFIGAEDLDIGDFNGDGHLDIVAGGSDDGGINIYYNDGTGRNWNRMPSKLPYQGWSNRVMARDINKDGRVDVVASFSEGPRVFLNMGGAFGEEKWQDAYEGLPTPMVKGLYTGVDVGDINNDGRLDLAFANWVDGPEVYLQEDDGSWKKTPDVFPTMFGGAVGLALGDVDRDGRLDIAVTGRLDKEAGFVRGVFVLKGDGHGGFSWIEHSGLPATGLAAMAGVAFGDVDGDTVLDLVACSGLIVESSEGRTSPVMSKHVLVWRTVGVTDQKSGVQEAPHVNAGAVTGAVLGRATGEKDEKDRINGS